MAYLWSVATALPPHALVADETKRRGRALYGSVLPHPRAYDLLVDHAGIARRNLVVSVDQLLARRSIGETSRTYAEATRRLGKEALAAALERAGISPCEVDAIVVCSSTGYMVPSLDAYLINELGLRPTTRRLAFGSLGCAGGAGGVSRAADAILARGDDAVVAMVAVETPSITFRPGDLSRAGMIASVLFGDGAAAIVMAGRPPPDRPSLKVRAARSWLHRDTYDAMGFRLGDDGFEVVLSPDIPELCARDLSEFVAELAGPADLGFFALHPGGRRVVDRIEGALALSPAATAPARAVLREHGNMSSPTVIFVLERILAAGVRPGALGLMCAFGPGFAAEAVLLEAVA